MSDALSSPPKVPIVVPNVWWWRKVQWTDENMKNERSLSRPPESTTRISLEERNQVQRN